MRANETRGTKTGNETMNATTKTQEISRRIIEAMTTHRMNVRQAINHVCGDGACEAMIDALYNELRTAA